MNIEVKTGEYLHIVRRRKQMTLEEAAESLGVSANTLGKWERSKELPSLTSGKLGVFLEFYGLDQDCYLAGEYQSI